jgi:hypothetical protein
MVFVAIGISFRILELNASTAARGSGDRPNYLGIRLQFADRRPYGGLRTDAGTP